MHKWKLAVFGGALTVLTAPSLHAQSLNTEQVDGRIEEMQQVWRGWMGRNYISAGSIAIAYDETIILQDGMGRAPEAPAFVASLSKTITATCMLSVLQENGLDHTALAGDILAEEFARSPERDPLLDEIQIGHLITHDSGVYSLDDDSFFTQLPNFTERHRELLMTRTLSLPLTVEPGDGAYYYSNGNYFLLGAAIEAITGEDYETACRARVLEPLGITTALLSPDWNVAAAFGGWMIAPGDYLRLLHHILGPDGAILGVEPDAFEPKIDVGRERYFGPGLIMASQEDGWAYWIFGGWTWISEKRNDRFGAFAAVFPNGISVSATYDHDGADDVAIALERLLRGAAYDDLSLLDRFYLR